LLKNKGTVYKCLEKSVNHRGRKRFGKSVKFTETAACRLTVNIDTYHLIDNCDKIFGGLIPNNLVCENRYGVNFPDYPSLTVMESKC